MGERGGEGWSGVINNSTKNNTHIGVFKFERRCVCLVRGRPDVITINHSPASISVPAARPSRMMLCPRLAPDTFGACLCAIPERQVTGIRSGERERES